MANSVIEPVEKLLPKTTKASKPAQTDEEKAAAAEAKAAKGKAAQERRETKQAAESELMEKIQALVDEGVKRSEIPKRLGVSLGKASLLMDRAALSKSERIGGTPEEMAEAIIRGRKEEENTWHQLTVRTGLGHAKVKALFDSVEGEGAAARHRVEGKGGRYADGVERPPAKAKAKAKGGQKFSWDAESETYKKDVINGITGKTVTIKKGNSTEQVLVRADVDTIKVGVNKEKDPVVQFVDDESGDKRTVKLEDIQKVH